MNPDDTPDDSPDKKPLETVVEVFNAFLWAAEELKKRDLSLGLQNRNEENLEEKKIREASTEARKLFWAIEEARRQKKRDYEVAKAFAVNMHSDYVNPKIVKKQEYKEDKVSGEGKSKFQKAKEMIKERREEIFTSLSTGMDLDLKMMTQRKAPTLMELSARALAKNSESIKSLNLVPDRLRKQLSCYVNDLGKINTRFMQLLIKDSPYEVYVKNCVDLEEQDLIQILCDCDRFSLTMLTLDLCGRAMTENAITEFLKRSPYGFPSLTRLSIQGAFCLTDNGLALISKSAPLLQYINLTDCSLLTSEAVKILAKNFGSTLRGLNIEGCQGIKRSILFSSSLNKFKNLNYLSVSGLISINDGSVMPFFMFCSSNLTDLSLAYCNEVTDECIWHIGRYCKKLEALDISELDNLTDASLEFLTEGCKYLNSVKLTGNRFSDEGVAAFLEVLGSSLNQLCLNKVRDVGPDTAISLAEVCKNLLYLDLSWCRRIKEEELRRILSCCSSLRSLRLFGWTHVEDSFLEELSRSTVHIIGLKMTSIYAHHEPDNYPSMNAKFF